MTADEPAYLAEIDETWMWEFIEKRLSEIEDLLLSWRQTVDHAKGEVVLSGRKTKKGKDIVSWRVEPITDYDPEVGSNYTLNNVIPYNETLNYEDIDRQLKEGRKLIDSIHSAV